MAAASRVALFDLNILAGEFMVVSNNFAGAGSKAHVCFLVWLGRIRILPPNEQTSLLVAQVSKPAVSPTSKSARRWALHSLRVWKPAIRQTWKSALRGEYQDASNRTTANFFSLPGMALALI
jgi:hypothetical protein